MEYIRDALDEFNEHEAENEKWLNSLPTCCECGEPIQQDTAVEIEGDWYCDSCLKAHRRSID